MIGILYYHQQAEGTALLTDNNKLLLADKARCGKIPVAAVR